MSKNNAAKRIQNKANTLKNAFPQEIHNEVSCINIKAVYEYVKNRIPDKANMVFRDLPGVYANIKNPVEVLTDENNWVSNKVTVKIFQNAKEILGDENAPFSIGMESIARKHFGYIQKIFLHAFGGAAGVLKRINQINGQFNTNKVVETVYSSPKHAVVRLHWKENRGITSDICAFNRGIYSAIPTLWKLPPAEVQEPYCFFKGDPYCQFNIHFQHGTRNFYSLFNHFRTRKSQLLSALEQIESDKLILKKKYDEVNRLNNELADEVEKLKAINVASNMLVSQDNTEEILKATMKSMSEVLKYDRAIIMLTDKSEKFLDFKYAFGEDPLFIKKYLHDYKIPMDREGNIIARAARLGRPIHIADPGKAGLRRGNLILSNFNVSSFIIAPLVVNEKVIGVVAADRVRGDRKVTSRDLDELSIFTNNIAETLHKAQLKEEIESSYLNTVKALVQAIEEKDAYTRGHSERVALISVRIGEKIGLEQKEIEYLRHGCLLHDVGKIGISESIVCKNAELTDEEYDIIKQHPIKGEEIVRSISFLQDHLYLIRNHHEWYDGSGYPDGLCGEEIPIGAQIVGVADAYDAITSTRPYRRGLPPGEALARINNYSGIQFSPLVVNAFREIFPIIKENLIN
ncbi:MAG: HD domain-containing protein [Spirochaetales bacterium]|nr:HD domain-containing protein [Spirochaetales bacterium]